MANTSFDFLIETIENDWKYVWRRFGTRYYAIQSNVHEEATAHIHASTFQGRWKAIDDDDAVKTGANKLVFKAFDA